MSKFSAMTCSHLQDIASSLSKGGGVAPVLEQVAALYRDEIGYRLFTITAIDRRRPQPARRLWSNHPTQYPVGGSKELASDEWTRKVIDGHEAMVCSTPEDIRATFPDHAEISGLGCGSGLNLPVVLDGTVLGTVNLFDVPEWFTAERVERSKALLALVYTPMIMARHEHSR